MKKDYDIIAVGMGPGAIFMAYELLKNNSNKKILLVDQGKRVEDRNCPIEKLGKCIKCKPFCNITSGFSGARTQYVAPNRVSHLVVNTVKSKSSWPATLNLTSAPTDLPIQFL